MLKKEERNTVCKMLKIKSSVPPKMNFERSPLPSKKRSMGERLTEKCKQERCAPERGKGKMKRDR